MLSIRRLMLTAACLLFTYNAAAGQDPIGWSQSGTLPATAELNHSYSINFTLVNNLPFTMPTALEISNNSSPSTEVTMVDGCTGLRLAPAQSCSVGLVLIPKTAGTKSLSVFMEYGKNKVKIPVTALTSQTTGASTSLLQGIAAVGFPTAILSNTTYPISFQFTNNGTTTLSSVALSLNPTNTAGYTQSSSSCSSTLAAGATCTVSGSFLTTATSGAVSIGYTMTTSTLSTAPVTSSIINNGSGQAVRTITFTNNCSQTVWFGLVGGAVNSNPCTTNAQCSNGSLCNPAANAGAGECFYPNPVPTNGTYQLTNGQSNTALLTDYGLQYVWSGNMAARTGATCATGTCDTGDCASGGGNNGCPIGRGFDQPATLAEFTLQRGTIDSYDVSMINGLNVGVKITPTTTNTFTPNGIAAYNCQAPGSATAVPSLGLGACDWAAGFIPPSSPSASSYVYVKPPTSSPTVCTADSDCTLLSPYTKCGLSFDKTNTTVNKYCGIFLGYLTPNQVCSFANTNLTPGSSNNPGDPYFPCDTAISGMPSYTNWAMYACKAQANADLGTCYNTSANPPASTANCCGCVNWQSVAGVTVPSDTTTCVNTNTAWTNISTGVQPGIEWMKKACPTAYSYPFDDKASGFGCMDINASHPVNTVNYTITFCPT